MPRSQVVAGVFLLLNYLASQQSLLGISLGAPASNQLDDEKNHRNHQDQVNQPAADLQRKTKQPENYENYQNCPEHSFFLSLTTIDYGMRSPRMISRCSCIQSVGEARNLIAPRSGLTHRVIYRARLVTAKQENLHAPTPAKTRNRRIKQKIAADSPWFFAGQNPCGACTLK
jgi:hypothetical protein